jgi:hypothetical protein
MSQFLCQELALSSGLLAGPRRGSVSSESALDQHVGDGNTLNGGLILPVRAPVVPHREVLRSRRSWSGSRKPPPSATQRSWPWWWLRRPWWWLRIGPGGGSVGPGPTSSIFSLINTRMELKGEDVNAVRAGSILPQARILTSTEWDAKRGPPVSKGGSAQVGEGG